MKRLLNHKKTAVNLRTKAEYDKLMELFEEEGWLWCNDTLPTLAKGKWEFYESNFCVDYHDKFGYADCKFYKNEGCEIITFKEFMRQWDRGVLLWHDCNKNFILEVDEI